jgi:hypothetical protein
VGKTQKSLSLNYLVHKTADVFKGIAREFGKGKVHLITGHEGSEGEQMYSCSLPSTLAIDGVGGQRHALAVLSLGKTRYPLYRRLGGPPEQVLMVAKNLAHHRDSILRPSIP